MNRRSIREGLLAAAFALSLAACAAEVGADTDDVGSASAPIVNGTFETGRPEVVFMYRLDGAACTGSIIAPRVVLTANHCVEGSAGPAAPSNFRIYVGSSVRALTAEYRVSEVRPVPNAGLDGRQANDVALLILSTPADETPIQLGRDDPRMLFGDTITAVGYGQTPSGGSGTKYTTTAAVDGVQGGFVFVEPAVCQGDSGGPLIGPDGLVYGVASFIYSPDGRTEPRCGTAPGAYNAIAQHMAFIDAVLEETGSCVGDEPEACNGEDDDCDEVVDEGCTPIGQPCASGDECVGGVCGDTVAGRLCTSACDPLRPDVGCGADSYCAGSGCEGWCVPGVAGTKTLGESCESDLQCASLFCRDPGDGMQRCLEPCRGDEGLCLAGEVCAAAAGACGACVDQEIVSGLRGLGEPCTEDDECRDPMVCYDNAGVTECASPCGSTDECPDGFECRSNACIRDRRQGVGGVCAANEDCGDGICAAQGGRRWCTAPCTTAGDCPAGFECVAAGTAQVCAPARSLDGESCDTNADCVSNLCAGVGGVGQVCTSYCDERNACAAGFECRRTSTGDAAVCVPPQGSTAGGCAVAGGSRSGVWLGGLLALIGLALGWRRRR